MKNNKSEYSNKSLFGDFPQGHLMEGIYDNLKQLRN